MIKENKEYSRKQIVDTVLKYIPIDIDLTTINYNNVKQLVGKILSEYGLIELNDSHNLGALPNNNNNKLFRFEDDDTYYQGLRYLLLSIRNDIIETIISERFHNNKFFENITEKEIIEYDINNVEEFIRKILYFVYTDNIEIFTLRDYVEFIYRYFDLKEDSYSYVPNHIEKEIEKIDNADIDYDRDEVGNYKSHIRSEKKDNMPKYLEVFIDLVISDVTEKLKLKKQEVARRTERRKLIEANLENLHAVQETPKKIIVEEESAELEPTKYNTEEESINEEIKRTNKEKEERILKLKKVLEEREALVKRSDELDVELKELIEKINSLKVNSNGPKNN